MTVFDENHQQNSFTNPQFKTMKSILTIILVLGYFSIFAQTPTEFFTTELNVRLNGNQSKELTRIKASENIKNTKYLKVGNLKSSQKKGKLTFTLPDGRTFTAKANMVKYKSEREYTWAGNIGVDDGSLTLYCKNGIISGHIIAGENHYELVHLGNGLYALNTIDFSKAANECGNIEGSSSSNISTNNSVNRIIPCSDVNVLVFFTPNALTAAGNVANVELIAGQSLAQFNQSLTNSQIFGSVARLVGVQELAGFDETADIDTDIETFATNAVVATQRNALGADIVILLTNGAYGGIFGVVRSPNIAVAENMAFAIVQINNSAANNTFAHEMGHIFGARHQTCDRWNNRGCDNTAVNAHGYNYCKGFWCFLGGNNGTRRSTLVHQIRPNYTRILNFSNPNVQVGGGATGTNTENNATQVSGQFLTVADFRAGNNIMLIGISGPVLVPAFSTQTWEADIRCGAPGFTFQWFTSPDGIDFTSVGSNDPSVTLTVGDADFFIRVIVTDATGQVGDVTLPVTIEGSCVGCQQELKIPTLPKSTQFSEVQISAYPNPSSENITFNLLLPNESVIKLDIIDYTGKIVSTVQNEKLPQGEYSAEHSVKHLPSGIYLYRLTVDDKTITKKIIISH
jgi:hypothetical protein